MEAIIDFDFTTFTHLSSGQRQGIGRCLQKIGESLKEFADVCDRLATVDRLAMQHTILHNVNGGHIVVTEEELRQLHALLETNTAEIVNDDSLESIRQALMVAKHITASEKRLDAFNTESKVNPSGPSSPSKLYLFNIGKGNIAIDDS